MSLRSGRCSCLKNLVPLLCSCDSQLIQKYFPAVPGKTLLVLAFFQREQCWSCREHLQERCSLSREETLGVVSDLLPTSYLCFCSTSDAIHQQECECWWMRTLRWPLFTAAGYKLVLLSRKVLYPVLSIRTNLCFHPGCTCTRTFPAHS